MKKVSVDIESVTGGRQEGYYLLGLFRRKAKEQGWSEGDIEAVTSEVGPKDLATTLEPYVEAPSDKERPSFWRLWLDYVEGFYASKGFKLLPIGEWRWLPTKKNR